MTRPARGILSASLLGLAFVAVLLVGVLVPGVAGAASLHAVTASAAPDFGPSVKIIDPSMSLSDIKATLDSISAQQVPSQFGTGRYAVFFMPGTYGTAQNPLKFQVGYYTDVAGLGASPNDVTINGEANVYNQCFGPNDCTALVNFWRSLANLTINVPGATGCDDSAEFWATSQATSMRRVQINGFTSLMDYCSQPAFASGGFIADSKFTGSTVLNGSQQQYLVRNSDLDGWTNGVWNQVFVGDQGAPAQAFPSPPYTTLATTPVSREKAFLYVDSNGNFNVWVPDVQTDSLGVTWANGQTPGHAKPISDFFIAKPSDSVATLNNALAHKKSLILTPGIYHFSQTMVITNPDTIVLGMGLATIVPQNGIVPVKVQNVKGVEISDVIFDAGPVNSPALLQIGNPAASGQNSNDPADPSVLSDVYFRIGGAHLGKATTSLVVDSDDVILDNIWAWRADHGTGVGWTSNTADTGVVVNGDDVTATGLFVEHYQKDEVVWNGQNGRLVFFQNEMPYDPPSQAAWTQPDGTLGYPAVKVGDGVKTFNAWGIGSYSFFNQGVDIHSANGFVVPTTLAPGSVRDAFTIFLSTAGSGGIDHVINGTGGSSTIANPDVVVPVLSYP